MQAGKAWDRIATASSDIGKVVNGVANGSVTLGEAVNVIGTSKVGAVRDMEEAKAKDAQYAQVVNNLLGDGRTASDVQSVLSTEVNGTAAVLGANTTNPDGTPKQVMVYDNVDAGKEIMHTPTEGDQNKNTIAGLTDSQTKEVAINLQNTGLQDGAQVERIATHEGTHEAGFGEGVATIMGDTAASVWADQNKLNGRTTNNSPNPVETQSNWLNTQHADPVQNAIIAQGNQFVSGVTNGEALPPNQLIENAQIKSNFGLRTHPITGKVTIHKGTDIVTTSEDKDIHAAADGTVIEEGYQYNPINKTGWGNYVVLQHNTDTGKYQTLYAHMQSQTGLKVGQPVNEGDSLGEVGATGGVTGPHLHFEIKQYNPESKSYAQINPLLDAKNQIYLNIGKYPTLESSKK